MSARSIIMAAAGSSTTGGAVPQGALLIALNSGTTGTTSCTFTMPAGLGGGTVNFTGHATYNNSSTWGPHQLADATRTAYDWCNLSGTSPLFGQWVFPVTVKMSTIFVIPRSAGDNFPASVTVKADSSTIGTYSTTTLSAGSGSNISYTGTGYKISFPTGRTGTAWRLEFLGSSNAYIGEVEFWGALA